MLVPLVERRRKPTVLRLSQIRVVTAVLVGDADIGDVFAFAGAIEATVQLATLEIWKGAGHLIQIEKPTQLVTRFDKFVTKVDRKEVPLGMQQLESYVGEYRVGTRTGTVFLKNERLVLEIRGDPYPWLFAGSEKRFFLRTADPEIEFEKHTTGKVIEMMIYNSDGSVVRCPRIVGG